MHDLTAPLLLNGDCMELLQKLPDSSVDLVLVDPPFGVTALEWDKALSWHALWPQLRRVLTPAGVAAVFTSNRFTYQTYNSNAKEYRYKWIWVKDQGTDFLNANVRPLTCTEEILVFYMGKQGVTWYEPQKTHGHKATFRHSNNDICPDHTHAGRVNKYLKSDYSNNGSRYPTNVFRCSRVPANERVHPSQKPLTLLTHLIKSHCPPGGAVLDFCMGSGSTGIAALQAGRRFVGMELDPDFFIKASSNVMLRYREAQCQQQLLQPSLTSMD